MSDITKAVRAYLLGNSEIATAVGTRIYPDVLPQRDGQITSDLPACTIEIISGSSDSALYGGTGLAMQRISITIYATTRSATRSLAEFIRRAMLKLRGQVGTEHVRCVTCESRQDLVDPPADGSNNWRYLHAIDFDVTHGESAAAV